MKFGLMVVAAMMVAGSWGCAAGPQVTRSPGFMPQPTGRAVTAQCFVEEDAHTIRHAVTLQRPGQLEVTADVKTGALNGEILIKSPSGQYVQHLVASASQRSYTMTLPAERGTWEIIVVCRRGAASYAMQAQVAPLTTVGATEYP